MSLSVVEGPDRVPGWHGRVAACLAQTAAVAMVGSHNLLMPTVTVAVAVEPCKTTAAFEMQCVGQVVVGLAAAVAGLDASSGSLAKSPRRQARGRASSAGSRAFGCLGLGGWRPHECCDP